MIPSSAWVPSFRALLIGAVGCLVVGAGFQYSDMILKTSGFGNWFFIPEWIIPHRELAQIRNFYEEFEPVRRDQVENRDFKHHVVQEVVAGIVGNKKGDLSGLP